MYAIDLCGKKVAIVDLLQTKYEDIKDGEIQTVCVTAESVFMSRSLSKKYFLCKNTRFNDLQGVNLQRPT